MGPYDQHLVRDFAAMELGFAVLLVCAAIWFERRLVLVAGAASLWSPRFPISSRIT